MKLSELCQNFDINITDIETIILEQEGHVNRVKFIPPPSQPLQYHSEQRFNELIYPYITVELKNGDVLDLKIGRYKRMIGNSCSCSGGRL